MYFETLALALAMEGHGIFVWPAYAIFFASVVALVVQPVRRYRRELQQIVAVEKRGGS